jgi:AdoMet-dependent rRNA methyltransferase SPB1
LFDDENLDAEDDDVAPPRKRRQTQGREDKKGLPAEEEEERSSDVVLSHENEDDDASEEEEEELDVRAVGAASNGKESSGFEEVPMSESDDGSDSGEEEFEALDDVAKAEVLALAKKFLRKKTKDDIMEAAYNRYAFHDEGLPTWFADDERKFLRPAPQITAEEYKAAKEQLRAIDARPIKKVAEAKARKRKRLQAKLVQARQKAEAIANQEDVPMKSKMREIEKLYAQAKSGRKSGKGKKKPSRNDQYKKKGPRLDARMRKDRRGQDAATRRAKNGKRGKRRG